MLNHGPIFSIDHNVTLRVVTRPEKRGSLCTATLGDGATKYRALHGE